MNRPATIAAVNSPMSLIFDDRASASASTTPTITPITWPACGAGPEPDRSGGDRVRPRVESLAIE